MAKLAERARGRWHEILPALGISARMLINRHGPCPVCHGRDRFRFDDKQGSGSWICNQAHGGQNDHANGGSAGTGIGLVMDLRQCDFATAARLIEGVIGKDSAPVAPSELAANDDEASVGEKYRQALGYWRAAAPIRHGDPADLYLRSRVGAYEPTRALRLIPRTSFAGREMAAMICGFADTNGDLAGVQRLFLTDDGRKYPGVESSRWNTGALPEGGAVRLAKPVSLLGIAEGVETALAAAALHRVPVWAALNANRLRVWQPPEGVREVVIFGDNDATYTGQSAAFALAERLGREGIVAQVMIPSEIGTDWNDVLATHRGEVA